MAVDERGGARFARNPGGGPDRPASDGHPAAGVRRRPHGRRALAGPILIGPVLGVVGPLALWPAAVIQIALPATIAGHVARGGGDRFLREDAPRIVEGLEWLLGLHAWAALVSTRPPWAPGAPAVRLGPAVPATAPGPGRALARAVTTLPAAIAQALLAAGALVPWVVSAASLVIARRQPAALARLQARLLARHARLLVRLALLDGP